MTLVAEIKPQGRSQVRIHSFNHYSLYQGLAGLVTQKQRTCPCSEGHGKQNVTCDGACESLKEVCTIRLQKEALDPTGKSGQTSQQRRFPSWALRDEYEFAGLEWKTVWKAWTWNIQETVGSKVGESLG